MYLALIFLLIIIILFDEEQEQDGIYASKRQGNNGLAETPAFSWLWEWEACTRQIQEKNSFQFS